MKMQTVIRPVPLVFLVTMLGLNGWNTALAETLPVLGDPGELHLKVAGTESVREIHDEAYMDFDFGSS